MPFTIVCVDDDPAFLSSRKKLLEAHNYHVEAYQRGEEALRAIASKPVNLAILDYEMPGMNGGELALAIRGIRPRLPIILNSATPERIPPAVQRLVDSVVSKLLPVPAFLRCVERLLSGKSDPKPDGGILNKKPTGTSH